jgi:hypothetical protein
MPIAIKSLTAGYPGAILDLLLEFESGRGTMMRIGDEEDRAFQELRRKIREARVLCPSVELLLAGVRFTGRLSVVVQNGRILKSGYEEGYFTRRQDERLVS